MNIIIPDEPEFGDKALIEKVIHAFVKDGDPGLAHCLDGTFASHAIGGYVQDYDRALREIIHVAAGRLDGLHEKGHLPDGRGFSSFDSAVIGLRTYPLAARSLMDGVVNAYAVQARS